MSVITAYAHRGRHRVVPSPLVVVGRLLAAASSAAVLFVAGLLWLAQPAAAEPPHPAPPAYVTGIDPNLDPIMSSVHRVCPDDIASAIARVS